MINFLIRRRIKILSVILYSTHCPKCNVLEKKLKQKGIDYNEVNDVTVMEEKGFLSVPMLEVDGKIMDFKEANDWINKLD